MSESTELVPQSETVPIAGGQPKAALIAYEERGVQLRSMEDAYRFAKYVIAARMAPKGFETPEAVLVAIQFGAEVGLGPMASLQNIALINGRPGLYGEAVAGVCQHLMESYNDEVVGSDDLFGYRVTVQRKGRTEPISRTFTVAMAKKAGLWGKAGPWSQYPERMLLARARTFAMRDAFPDALRGIRTVEELRDHPDPLPVRSLDELDKPKEIAV